MALGIPVISTDCGGMSELIIDGENDDLWIDANESIDELATYGEVSIKIEQNCPPVAKAGKYITYNRGKEDTEFKVYTENLRAHTGYAYTLDGRDSFDWTPFDDITYTWTVPDGISLYVLNVEYLLE